MPNPDPYKARLAKRRKRAPGDLQELLRALWNAIADVETVMEGAESVEDVCKCAHALAGCGNTYAKLLQIGEYEARLARLEQWMEISRDGAPFPTDAARPVGDQHDPSDDS
jgi:hypothetical protein